MNNVVLIGRLTKDPELRWSNDLASARFSLAINRIGKDKGADFPSIVVFGKQAENCEKYLTKGRQVCIQGHLQTGSYTNKEGNKVYTTDVIADRVEFLEWGDREEKPTNNSGAFEGFEAVEDDDVPF